MEIPVCTSLGSVHKLTQGLDEALLLPVGILVDQRDELVGHLPIRHDDLADGVIQKLVLQGLKAQFCLFVPVSVDEFESSVVSKNRRANKSYPDEFLDALEDFPKNLTRLEPLEGSYGKSQGRHQHNQRRHWPRPRLNDEQRRQSTVGFELQPYFLPAVSHRWIGPNGGLMPGLGINLGKAPHRK